MKEYPTISREIHHVEAYVFDKLDGSNTRAEWSRKRGFYKFGSRKRLIGTDQDFLPEAIDLIRNNFEDNLINIFRKQRYEKAVCFFEFWGKNSFAGNHEYETHKVTLIDVSPHKKGILLPREFLKLFENLDIAKLLYYGNINHPFVSSVKENRLKGITMEGVVCKTVPIKKGYPPLMFKIKTNEWIERLKHYCGENKKLFNELL